MIASDAATDVHSPSPLMINLEETVRIFHRPVTQVPQIDLPMVCKRGFISKQTVSKEKLLFCK
jgi:hypothetical protein